ncbi:MAG: hypothetical protein MUP44_13630 [Anaerolineales bacterium]|nr:hypothetical protein [Anaerolineales bacterium]
MKSHHRNGLLAGSIIALAVSVFVSQWFKPGLFSPPWLIAWYLGSLLCGGGAGFVGGLLVSLIPTRLISAVGYIVGALFGVFGFYLQVYLFLFYVFRNNPTSF